MFLVFSNALSLNEMKKGHEGKTIDIIVSDFAKKQATHMKNQSENQQEIEEPIEKIELDYSQIDAKSEPSKKRKSKSIYL